MVFQAAPSFALVGGPWDNNSYEGNNEGIYTAIMTMRNGSGIARFGVSGAEDPTISRFSESVVFYRGIVYLGSTFGHVDSLTKTVTAVTEGQTLSVAGGGPTQFCNTSWSGKIKNTRRSNYFTAKGEASFFGSFADEFLPASEIEKTETANGPVDPVTQTPIFTIVTVTTTTIPGVTGPNAAFPEIRTRTRVMVFGSRTSSITPGYPSATALPRTGVGADAISIGLGGGGAGGGGAGGG